MQKIDPKLSTLKNLGLVALLSISFSNIAYADHKIMAPNFDIAAKGTNYSGYASIARCNSLSSQPCSLLVSQCGLGNPDVGNSDVYASNENIESMLAAIGRGQDLPVWLMTSTGHFLTKICTLGN